MSGVMESLIQPETRQKSMPGSENFPPNANSRPYYQP